jgi:hypothetical protein
MKVTVCELRNDADGLHQDWKALVEHVKSENSDLVLLPEMPFHQWVARTNKVDPAIWEQAVIAHDQWIPRLSVLAPACLSPCHAEEFRGQVDCRRPGGSGCIRSLLPVVEFERPQYSKHRVQWRRMGYRT